MPNDEKPRIQFGGNYFTDFSVPLVYRGRYFILEPGEPPLITVFLEKDGQIVFEIFKNQPSPNESTEVTSTPVGIVTVTDNRTGKFLYKVRPENETSVVFGSLDGGEVPVLLSDKKIMVGTSTFEGKICDGIQTGITVKEDGSIGVGGSIPPIILQCLKSIHSSPDSDKEEKR